MSGRNVVVTGGAGFIGSHLVERLIAAGENVTVVDDLSSGSAANLAGHRADIALVEGDCCDPGVAAVAGDADLVFHLAVRNVRASISDPRRNLAVNAGGTLEVLEAMRTGRRGRFVYVSSSEVYGTAPAGAFAEDTLPAPTTVYGAGKLAGEHLALAYHGTYGMDTMVVRPFNNYGPRSHFEGDSGEVIPKFVLRALAGEPLLVHGDGSQARDFVYVEDTAGWLVDLAATATLTGEVVNIGYGREISVIELATMILDATGSTSSVEHVAPRPGDLPRLLVDVTKVRKHSSFRPAVDFEEGLRRTIYDLAGRGDPKVLLEQERDRNWT